MNDQWLTLLTALSSAIVGGAVAIFGVMLSNRGSERLLRLQIQSQEQQSEAQRLRAKGEELYEFSSAWLTSLAGYYLRRNLVMKGRLSYRELSELDRKAEKEEKLVEKFSRIEMLTDVYFPAARDSYDEVIQARTDLNKIAIAHERAHNQGQTEGSSYLEAFLERQVKVEKAGDRFLGLLREQIREV